MTIITSGLLIGVVFYVIYFRNLVGKPKITEPDVTANHNVCLKDNEIVDYPLDSKYNSLTKTPQIPLTVLVKDKLTNQIKFQFQVNDVPSGQSRPLEIHKCGLYVLRQFNFDSKLGVPLSNFAFELWRYDYSGRGVKIITLFQDKVADYSPIFFVDPSEKYIELTRGYIGSIDASVVVLDIGSSNLSQALSVTPKDLLMKTYSLAPNRDIGAVGWTSDGDYLWGGSESQSDEAYFRIRAGDKTKETLQVFKMPGDAVNYGPPNPDTGYIAYVYGPAWGGGDALTQKQISDRWVKGGKTTTLYLYNLFTKDKVVIATSPLQPTWNFSESWLSDTELQYTLPSGEVKTYTIK